MRPPKPALYAVVAAVAAIFGSAGCSSTSTGTHPPVSPAGVAEVLPARALPSPGCSTASAAAPTLNRVHTAMVRLGGNPFGVVVTHDGRWAFVAQPSGIEVLRPGGQLAPVRVRTIALPSGAAPLGEALSSDGRYLLVASGSGAIVISVARAEQGGAGAVLGTLSAPNMGGAIEVAASRDGNFAFVTEEGNADAAVFNLRRALTRGFGPADYVGSIPLGIAPVGMAVSPDGRWLYATSEVASMRTSSRNGTLSVIDVRRAETKPASSVVAVANAGCGPVRVITSADGREVWVDARESDDLLCFSAARLLSGPAHAPGALGALVAVVRVGEAPVGLALVRGGTRVVVADSNRFGAPGASSDLGVVNVAAALAGKPAFIARIPAGKFPREMALEPGDAVLLVTNWASGQLEAVEVATIPLVAGD